MRFVLITSGVAAAVVAIAASCSPLPQLGSCCGNKVVDDGEDCDGNYDGGVTTCIAPELPSACHYSCATSPSACPPTFTCGGIDHVCRRPAGTFDDSVTIAGETARRVLVADFDGDGAKDVVTVGLTSRVHFFDGHTSTRQTLLSSDATLPAIGHVTLDGRASGLVTSTYFLSDANTKVLQGNVRVWRGSLDRTLLPTVYPNIDFPPAVTDARAVSVLRSNQLGSDIFALLTFNGNTGLYYVNGTEQTQANLPEPASNPANALGDPQKIHGRIPVGALGDSSCTALTPFNVCQAIVLAFEGDKTVSIHSSCDKTGVKVNVFGSGTFQPPLTVTLPNNDTVLGPAFLFAPNSSAAPTLYVVGAQGTYAFPPDGTGCTIVAPTAPLALPPASPPPLALGFIADLVHLAWVDATGVHVDTGSEVITTAAPPNTTWSDAVIGDMNLNGLPDVVAIGQGSIDFYNGTASVLLNGKHITLDGTATHMTIGDFDGDFVSDIAVSTHADSTGLSTDSIDVAFGTFTGFPSQPVSIGRLSKLLQLEPAYFDYRIAGSPDLIDTLFASGKSDNGDLVVSILQGNPDRLINSPFFLFDPGTSSASLVATAVADFEADKNGHEGMAGISATKTGVGLWYTPMTGDAQVDPSKEVFGDLPSGVSLDGSAASVAAIDVGGDAGKELLVIESGNFFLTHVVTAQSAPWPSLAYEKLQILPLPDKGIVTRVVDVDGDGDDDVIVEYVDSSTSEYAAKIIVNAKNGTLSFTNATTLALPQGTIAVASIHASKDGTTQLLALSQKGVYLTQMSNGSPSPWPSQPLIDLSALATLATPVVVRDAIAGDVDGDGVDDIVIATSSGFMVFFGDAAK